MKVLREFILLLQGAIPFLAVYPTWFKIAIAVWLVTGASLVAGLLFLRPSQPSPPSHLASEAKAPYLRPAVTLTVRASESDAGLDLQLLWMSTDDTFLPEETRRVPFSILEDLRTQGIWRETGLGVIPDRKNPAARELTAAVIPESLQRQLSRHSSHHLMVLHDRLASRLPWEYILRANALNEGVSRKFIADTRSAVSWNQPWRPGEELKVLLIVPSYERGPFPPLPGAWVEAQALQSLFEGVEGVRLELLEGEGATRPAVRAALQTGRFNLVHFAGHAVFDPTDPVQSGLICADGAPLTATDLDDLLYVPELIFANAADSARLAGTPKAGTAGVAEAFLAAGAPNFIGITGIVSDSDAVAFAKAFYAEFLDGYPVGRALTMARKSLLARNSWGGFFYAHYGNASFGLN